MNDIVSYILGYTALTLIGCLCGFFIVMNWIKQEEKRKENNDDKNK